MVATSNLAPPRVPVVCARTATPTTIGPAITSSAAMYSNNRPATPNRGLTPLRMISLTRIFRSEPVIPQRRSKEK